MKSRLMSLCIGISLVATVPMANAAQLKSKIARCSTIEKVKGAPVFVVDRMVKTEVGQPSTTYYSVEKLGLESGAARQIFVFKSDRNNGMQVMEKGSVFQAVIELSKAGSLVVVVNPAAPNQSILIARHLQVQTEDGIVEWGTDPFQYRCLAY